MKKIVAFVFGTVLIFSSMGSFVSSFPGKDKFTAHEYKDASVNWEHHTFLPDAYSVVIFGVERNISQDDAERITQYYKSLKERLIVDGIKDVKKIRDIYFNSINFAFELRKNLEIQLEIYKKKYEDARLKLYDINMRLGGAERRINYKEKKNRKDGYENKNAIKTADKKRMKLKMPWWQVSKRH
ncbi:MAG: hypothetical protein LBK29_03815 [Oscillospiraceae bacterium]|jgi:hypothetical protein|nr:hypothetical protein [Oscillospiraceae bacterium]